MKTTFIYALCEPGTRTVRYIGKTSNPKRRLRDHVIRSSTFKTHLGCWLKSLKERKESPEMVILREVPIEQWQTSEERYIRLARGMGMALVNGSDGGEGVTQTPEVRRKIGEKNRGKPNPMKGRSRPPEVGAAISASKRGHEVSVETRKQISETLKSQKLRHPPEWCDAMSRRMTGENHPQFGKRGAESPNFGKACSPERKANISAARLAGIARRKQQDQDIEGAMAPYTLTD